MKIYLCLEDKMAQVIFSEILSSHLNTLTAMSSIYGWQLFTWQLILTYLTMINMKMNYYWLLADEEKCHQENTEINRTNDSFKLK